MSVHVRYRGPRRWRASLPIAAAVLCAFTAAGVVTGPALELEAARERWAASERRALAATACRAELDRFDTSNGDGRLGAARERVDARFPHDPSPIVQHAVLRLVATEHAVALSALSFGADVDLGLETNDDRIVRRDVDVAGRATAGALVEFVEDLRGLLAPALVLEARLVRDDPGTPEFDFALRLGLLHATAPAPRGRNEEGP